MISVEERTNLINSIPDEGKNETLSGTIFLEGEINAIVDRFFEGKAKPFPEQHKTAEIFHGAQGSGKSFFGKMRYDALDDYEKNNTIFISYDESGALFGIDEYIEKLKEELPDFTDEHSPVSADTFDIRQRLWEEHRPVSQLIRSRILKRALEEGYNVMIDTTSSSKSTLKLIDTLKDLGYDDINVVGTYAGFDKSLDRIKHRVRPESDEQFISKRIGDPAKNEGTYNMTAALIAAADGYQMYHNPNDTKLPELAFSYQKPSRDAEPELIYSDAEILDSMFEELVDDVKKTTDFIEHNIQDDKQAFTFFKQTKPTYLNFGKVLDDSNLDLNIPVLTDENTAEPEM